MADRRATDDLDLALRLADVADDIASRRFRAADLAISTKADGSVVTDADRAVEEAVRDLLALERPHDLVLGEELGGPPDPGGRRWVIDPIDGTTAYADGRERWAFLAGLEVDGVVTTGVVSAPALGRRYWAAAGQGAWGGDTARPARQWRVSTMPDLIGARAAFALPAAVLAPRLGAGLVGLSARLRPAEGEPALAVATGRADVGFKSAGGPWDLAAFWVIVSEAGGRCTDPFGGTSLAHDAAVVSNGVLHDALLLALAGEGAAAEDSV